MITSAPIVPSTAEHRFRLGGSSWWMWRDGVLRSTGFPVSGLDRLSAPALAGVADAHLAGAVSTVDFEAEVARATAALSREVDRIVADDRLREAVTWEQSPEMILDSLLRTAGSPRDQNRRDLESKFGRIWQRYCAVNDTIGFFGPFRWITLDPERSTTVAAPGDTLLALRKVFFEPWALAAYGARLAEDPAMRQWMPPSPRTHHFLDGLTVQRPGRPPLTLAHQEAAAISSCDGRRPATLVAAQLVARGMVKAGDEAAAFQLLDDLVARKLLEWDANLPIGPHTEDVLVERIAAIADDRLRRVANDGLDRLRSIRDIVADAAGDPDALAAALAKLDTVFAEVTGRKPRRPGHGYPGRGICYEDTLRDACVTIGRDLLDAIEPPLVIVLQAARWLTAELARRFEDALQELVPAGGAADERPSLADVWDRGVDLLIGPREQGPFARVLSDFEARWRELLGLDDSSRRLAITAAQLQKRASRLFAADRPGWSMARIHSPDLLICAQSVDAIDEGSYLAVLGELHIAYATHCIRTLTWALPDPMRLPALGVQDLGRPRMIPLMPPLWSSYAGRSLQFDEAPHDRYIGFARATGVAADRVIPTSAVRIERINDGFAGRLPDRTLVPLIEFFAAFLSMCSTNSLREAMQGPHTPRVTIDRVVVWRETWRLSREDIDGLGAATEDMAMYLAGRRLVARRGLPDRCFVRVSTEKKPIYVDFTSPLYVSSLGSMVRSGLRKSPHLEVTVTEMLPSPDQTWLVDADGNHYFAELRLQVTDSEPARARGW